MKTMSKVDEQRMLKWIDRDLKMVEKTLVTVDARIAKGANLDYYRKGLLRREDELYIRRHRILAPTLPANDAIHDCSQIPCQR